MTGNNLEGVTFMNVFEENIVSIYREQGRAWLDALPTLVVEISKKYKLSDVTLLSNLTFNFVAEAKMANQVVILKMGLNEKALLREARCLEMFKTFGAVKLLAYEKNMLLMEKAQTNNTLKKMFPDNDDDAVKILCQIIKRLQQVKLDNDEPFTKLETLLKALDKSADIPHDILLKARLLKDSLLKTTHNNFLLHGDLHHDNLLKNGDGYVVIDPKGFVGDPVFEVVTFILNPIQELLEQACPRAIIKRRIMICAQSLGFCPRRIADWAYVKCVLNWLWSLEDNLDPTYWRELLTYF